MTPPKPYIWLRYSGETRWMFWFRVGHEARRLFAAVRGMKPEDAADALHIQEVIQAAVWNHDAEAIVVVADSEKVQVGYWTTQATAGEAT